VKAWVASIMGVGEDPSREAPNTLPPVLNLSVPPPPPPGMWAAGKSGIRAVASSSHSRSVTRLKQHSWR